MRDRVCLSSIGSSDAKRRPRKRPHVPSASTRCCTSSACPIPAQRHADQAVHHATTRPATTAPAYFKRYEENGEYVFFDEIGPGCLYRQQMNVFSKVTKFPDEEARIRFYFDDEAKAAHRHDFRRVLRQRGQVQRRRSRRRWPISTTHGTSGAKGRAPTPTCIIRCRSTSG